MTRGYHHLTTWLLNAMILREKGKNKRENQLTGWNGMLSLRETPLCGNAPWAPTLSLSLQLHCRL